MSSSTPRIRKRPVVTYSKKSRTFLDDANDIDHVSKRLRIATPESEDAHSTTIDDKNCSSVLLADITSGVGAATDDGKHENDSEGKTNIEEESTTSMSLSDTNTEARALKPDSISLACTKMTGFTISTRRKPLFKRHTAKKTDTASASPPLSSAPSSTHSSSSVPSSLSTNKSQKPKLVQMQIDLDGIGAPKVSCKECGMQYVPSAEEDAKLHKRYHAQAVEGLEFGNARGKVVWEGKMEGKGIGKRRSSTGGKKDVGKTGGAAGTPTGEKENLTPVPITRFFASGRGEKMVSGKKVALVDRGPISSTSTCYVVEITRRSTPTEKKKAVEFLRFANNELSAQEVAESVLWGTSTAISGVEEAEKGEKFKIYLYLEGTKCIGLCLTEKIKEAQWAAITEGGASISCSLDISDIKQPALLGISRIWTSPKRRRHGVASRLVKSAVESFVYGMKVESRMVAFSQPTDSGAWFALGWAGGQDVRGEILKEDAKEGKGFLVYLDGV